MHHNPGHKMDRKLLSMRPATRLTCVWLPTTDPRSPLTCVWQRARTTKPASLSSAVEEGAQPSSAAQGETQCA
jgi:hypothetical protein